MKVGLLESRAARLSGYWSAFLRELGADVAVPALSDAEALALGRESLPGEPPPVQLVLGRILGLGRIDAVLVPEWPEMTGDAWSQALTELLPRRISGLPTLIAVPDHSEGLEQAATELGFRLTRSPGRVRLALEKVRPLASGKRESMPALTRASQPTVAVIGPRPLLDEAVLSGGLRPALEALDLYPVFGPELPLADVLSRAERMDNAEKAGAGERELFGAASLLSGKSAVRGLLLVAPQGDGSALAALRRVAARMHKPTLLLEVAGGEPDWPELAAFARRLGADVTSRPADAAPADPTGDPA